MAHFTHVFHACAVHESRFTIHYSPPFEMTFRRLSAKYLEPGFMWLMVFGIIALCQPWVGWLHAWGVSITFLGLVGFSIFSKIKPLPEED